MLYHKRCNLKTKQVSLGGDRKANLPNFDNSLQMWKSFIVLIHNFSLVNRIVEEIWTEWSIIITSSEKNIGNTLKWHQERLKWKGRIMSEAIWLLLVLVQLIRPLDYIYRGAELTLTHYFFSWHTGIIFALSEPSIIYLSLLPVLRSLNKGACHNKGNELAFNWTWEIYGV